MHSSEIVSICWLIFFLLFAVAAWRFADRDRNKDRIEWMKAVIFANIAAITVFGAMAPEWITHALELPWRAVGRSPINAAILIISMLTAWATIQWAVEWLAALAAAFVVIFGTTWIMTHYIFT